MKAVTLTAKPESRAAITNYLRVATVPVPEVRPDQVLVRVRATSLNIEDIMIGAGWRFGSTLSATEDSPVVLGQELSGEVEAVGNKVTKFKPGDLVLGHKMPFRVRYGSWAELVSLPESSLVLKPATYSHAQAAALPMQCQVAHAAVSAAGFIKLPVLETLAHKALRPEQVDVEDAGEGEGGSQALITMKGAAMETVTQARVAVVGASSTTGLMVTDMLVSRGVPVLGVCSAPSAPTVISNGAVAVLDRNRGGLAAAPPGLQLEVVIDCVGGREVEAAARKALGHRGHFVTVVGPDTFGDEIDSASGLMAHMASIAIRTLKGKFSGSKYSLPAMPLSGGARIIEQHLRENLKSVVDSEVDLFNQEAMIAAVDKVNSHKTRGRLILKID